MDYQANPPNSPLPPYPPYPPQYPAMQPHRGTLILVFGIVGLVSCGLFGLLAWIFGNEDLKKMNAGIMDPAGRDNTNTGRILGIVAVCLNGLGILAGIIAFVFSAGIMQAAGSSLF